MAYLKRPIGAQLKEGLYEAGKALAIGALIVGTVPASILAVAGAIQLSGRADTENYRRAEPIVKQYLARNEGSADVLSMQYFGHKEGSAHVLVNGKLCLALPSAIDDSTNPVGNLFPETSLYRFSGEARESTSCKSLDDRL